jgi:molybdenum cofactor cytidylyltransferase
MRAHSLRDALGVRDRDIVAVVGAGGKTSLLGRLAFETVASGGRAIVTSTTHFSIPEEPNLPLVTAPDLAVMRESLEMILRANRGAVVASAPSTNDRYLGYPPEAFGFYGALRDWSLLVVNADGAKMRALKAPAAHEPVIPTEATMVVAVAGLDVLGARLDEERVFRPELVSAVTGAPLGSEVTERLVAEVLASPGGGRKGVPYAARYVAVLNKADDEPALEAGRRIATKLHAAGVDRVVLCSLKERRYEVAD